MADSLCYALIADLFTALETDGSPPGTDIHLRVQALLKYMPEDVKPAELKTLLAPVFCKNKGEQERFYQLFEASWKRVSEVGILENAQANEEIGPGKIRKKKQIRRIWWLTGGTLLLLGALGIWKFSGGEKRADAPRETRAVINLSVDEEGDYRFDSLLGTTASRPFSHEHRGGDSAPVLLTVDTLAFHIRYHGIRPGTDSISLHIQPKPGSESLHKIIFNVVDTTGIDRTVATTSQRDCVYIQRPLPYPRDLNRLLPPQPTRLQRFLLDYEWWIKVAFAWLSGLLLWLLAKRAERKRKKLIAEHQPNGKPPYSWNIVMDGEPELIFSEYYYDLLNKLRRRESDEFWRLDVPKTIHATIQKGGMPNFRYTQQTRPSEYLLLLDTQSARDHRAQLFNLLYKNFRSQEIIAERYYYDGDPRLCWNEARPKGITLRELQYNYPQSRLLLVGNGYRLLNPQTGRLAKWTHLLSSWNDRALLSPQPVNAWGRRERALREQFHVLPAALSGLREAIERFDADDQKETDITPHNFPDAQYQPVELIENDLIKTLLTACSGQPNGNGQAPPHSHHMVNWIAACAVYPELHWDLTLYLGNLLSTEEHALLTAENIAQLCRLGWFTEGKMPEDARKVLLWWLEENNPAMLLRVREGLHQILINNPPPDDSAAFDDYAMNLAINEWLFTPDKRRKRELEKEIAARLSAGQDADFTVVKVLDRPRSPLDFVVPDAWRKFMYHKGSPLLGAKAWLWALPLWLVLNGLSLWWKPEKAECKGKTVFYREKEFCLENFREEFIMTEIRLTDAILTNNNQDLALCLESYEKSFTDDRSDVEKPFADSSYSNVAQACFNAGTDYKTAGNRDSACVFFELANFFNTSVSDTLQLWYVRKAAQACKNPGAGSFLQDIVLRGQMQDSITKGLIPQDAFSKAVITAKGLPNGYLLSKGQFRVDVPGDWNSPVIITVTATGYQPKTVTVMPGNFDRNVVVPLNKRTESIAVDTAARINSKTALLPVYPEDPKMSALVDSILRINGITQRTFRIQIGNVQNVRSAITQGENYLLHSSKFPDHLSDWANIGMVAHEVGHLVLGHDFKETDAVKRKQIELEADRFMGTTLARMGATREEALSALDLAGEQQPQYYPPKSAREQATAIAFDDEMQKMAAADGDGDGVPDREDKCPKIKGTKERNGCPAGNLFREHVVVQGESLRSIATKYGTDLQKLAVANGMNINEKPMAGKIVLIPVPEDTDGDGVPDNEDKCPNEKGSAENRGCPREILYMQIPNNSKDNYAKNIKANVEDDKIVFTFDIPPTRSSDVYDIELKTDSKSGVIPRSVEGTGKGFKPKSNFEIIWYYQKDGYTRLQASGPEMFEVVAKRRKSKP